MSASLLSMLLIVASGCCNGPPKELKWRLLKANADPTGDIRASLTLDAARASNGAVVIPGGITSVEWKVNRWNVYEVSKIYEFCPVKKEFVVDPHGHPFEGEVSPDINAGQRTGIPREPTGEGWDPLDATRLPPLVAKWKMPDMVVLGQTEPVSGQTDIKGDFPRFTIEFPPTVVASIARSTIEKIRVEVTFALKNPGSMSGNGQSFNLVEIRGASQNVDRELFVQAMTGK